MNAPNPLHWTLNSSFGASHSDWVHLGSFPNRMKLAAKQGKLVQLMQSSCHEVTSGFFAMNTPNPLRWTLNSCFRVLHSVWVHLLSFCNCMKLDAKRGKLVQLMQSSCHEVTSGFFAMNTPNPPHWTLNSCFGAFHSVWVHIGSFHNCMKVGAKRGNWCN